jgi:aspartokinase-like uncharacterized kinase
MWIVKIGGSFCSDPRLPDWLELVTRLGGGRVALVCGGGTLANEVRRLQGHWNIDDLPAHNMAVLAMVQTAYMLHGLNPALQPVSREVDVPATLRRGRVALWMPLELLRHQPDANTNWDVTSDSIALGLARRLNAERLVVLKACVVDDRLSIGQLVDTGVLDQRFATLARQTGLPIDVFGGHQFDEVRALLLGSAHYRLAGSG